MITVTTVLLFSHITCGQFPSICNTPENLQEKTCCPNNCRGQGTCRNITELANIQSQSANPTIIGILQNAPNVPAKGTADARYLWPTVVFEKVCLCDGNFWGGDCSVCNFGWRGNDCNVRKKPVVRKSFARLSKTEKMAFITATKELKKENNVWSVVSNEPASYSSGHVTLQNVSTYDFFIYLHDYVARDCFCGSENMNVSIDFAHAGPVFPVWHRRYLLTVEREFQRIMKNDSFGLPYWQWEQNDKSMFAEEYYGVPSNSSGPAVNVSGLILNPEEWNTICDITYWNESVSCRDSWRACNPANDLTERRPLQRGGMTTYLPNVVEVMVALAAPSYDAPDKDGQYSTESPRASFRSRVEGWNMICSAMQCVGTFKDQTHMHNNVHIWVHGQMDDVPAAVNDPVFNLHHCNVDRIIESWMQRFANGKQSPTLLPAYVPTEGAHPGHNRDDFIVPFFPLITAGNQYSVSEVWGYMYDELVLANIPDSEIPTCSDILMEGMCPICDADGSCIGCTTQTCPAPNPPTGPPLAPEEDDTESNALELGLGLGLGIPLLIAIVIILTLAIIIIILCRIRKKPNSGSNTKEFEMTAKT